MNFQKIIIHNFLTISEAKIELDERGLLLIQGKNEDDPSAESNGAGKSSVVDALCWALFGTTARGVTGDAVVNKTAKKDCAVFVHIKDNPTDDFTYVIQRYRKSGTYKNQLMVFKDTPGTHPIDLSKGTDKETQEVVNQIVGCSLDVFMAAVYAGQEKMPDLPGMTDKMLKTLIEEAAGVEVLTEAYSVARNRYNAAKAQADATGGQLSAALEAQVRLDVSLADMEDQSTTFEAGRRDRAKAELARVLPVNAEIKRAEEALTTWPARADLQSELDDIDAKLKAHKAEETEYNKLATEAMLLDKSLAAAKSTIAMKKNSIANAEEGLARIEEQIGKPCGECGKTYCEHDLEAARLSRKCTIASLKKDLLDFANETKKLMAQVAEAQETAAKFKAGMTDVTAVALRQRELTNLLSSIDATVRSIEAKRKEVESIKVSANVKLTETNPWTKAIEAKKKEIAATAEEIKALEERVEELEATAAMLADAVKVFGPAGVRAHILDTVTPYLNDRTREYLGALADGNIHATWATLSKTAKGDLKEKFNIEVTNDKGAESFAGLSGGEKRKVRLATAMALQDMVASRATKPINIFVGDEIDHALDEAGLERLMTLLERKAKERGTVLVISHNSLSDWVDQVITVTKKGGFATVDGDNLRTL